MNNYNDWPEMAQLQTELAKTRRLINRSFIYLGITFGFAIGMIVLSVGYYVTHATH